MCRRGPARPTHRHQGRYRSHRRPAERHRHGRDAPGTSPHRVLRRPRHRAPWTNGVVERWIRSLKYEHLYRHDIASGVDLADHVTAFTADYNATCPHQALNQKPPLDVYLEARTPQPNPLRTEQNS